MRGQVAFHAGHAAEAVVARHYESLGYTVADVRWRGTAGEVDLIVRDIAGLVFVEVKKSDSFDAAAARLTARQMRRIYTAAEEYLAGQPLGSLTEARFDAALVDGTGRVQIVENAFGAL
ncbi:YraN family protein [Roseobacter sp. WL0113]|uniref:UPF0102 protein MUB52_08285 n=1 Tax=Roseobacter sinensis TaxID=2931391 RepID=A0ABT3BCY5_9RHOB|nr:YraN family protein [Roseobacter sp. WL0113]MCV3271422.1 YraN family protein [Roseobacter sp. WL0113]